MMQLLIPKRERTRQKIKTRVTAAFARFVFFNKKKAAKHPKIVNLHWSKKTLRPGWLWPSIFQHQPKHRTSRANH